MCLHSTFVLTLMFVIDVYGVAPIEIDSGGSSSLSLPCIAASRSFSDIPLFCAISIITRRDCECLVSRLPT